MRGHVTRVLSLTLAVILTVGSVPLSALAQSLTDGVITEENSEIEESKSVAEEKKLQLRKKQIWTKKREL